MRNKPNLKLRLDQQMQSAIELLDFQIKRYNEKELSLHELNQSIDAYLDIHKKKLMHSIMEMVNPEYLAYMQKHPGYKKISHQEKNSSPDQAIPA